jgi:hypothetical protein
MRAKILVAAVVGFFGVVGMSTPAAAQSSGFLALLLGGSVPQFTVPTVPTVPSAGRVPTVPTVPTVPSVSPVDELPRLPRVPRTRRVAGLR